MATPKSSRSALLALAVSGGLWAWQNRDKISGWVNQQRQAQQQRSQQGAGTAGQTFPGAPGRQIPVDAPYTGSTRRMDEGDLDPTNRGPLGTL